MDRDPSPSSIPPGVLVEHAAFVRSVALAVLHDDSDADDVAQDTLARGLTTGSADPGARRPWLIAVARNFARRLVRRESRLRTREQRVSRGESTGSTLDAASRQETLHAVAHAVDALDLPSREVVLLRHYDGLPPREIAERLGLPVETVKKRLVRAHHLLRVRLESGGARERARRRSALGAFAGIDLGPKSVAATATGGLIMAATGKTIGFGVVALLALGFGAWRVFGRGPEVEAVVVPVKETTSLAPPVAPPELAASGKAPAPVPVPVPTTESKPASGKTLPWSYMDRGRVKFGLPYGMAERGEPKLEFVEGGRWVGQIEGASSATWSIVSPKDAEAWLARLVDVSESVVTIDQREARMSRGKETTAGVESRVRLIRLAPLDGFEEPFVFVSTLSADATVEADALLDLVLSRIRIAPMPAAVIAAAGDVPGDVVEVAVLVDGVPATGTATIERQNKDSVVQYDGSWRHTLGAPLEVPLSPDGRARFDRVEAGAYDVTVRGPMIGAQRVFTQVTGRVREAHPRLVIPLGSFVVRGHAYARDGSVAAGARIFLHPSLGVHGPLRVVAETEVDAEGRYELRGLPKSHGLIQLVLPPIAGVLQAPRMDSLPYGPANPIEFDLGDSHPMPIWRGSIVDAGGRPMEGPGELRFVRVKARPNGAFDADTAVVAKDGRFEARVAAGAYRVTGTLVRPNAAPRYLDKFDIEIPEIGLERDVVLKGGGTLVVRIQSEAGATNVGVMVDVELVGVPLTSSRGSSTGRKGTARFDDLPAGRYRISVADKTVTLVGGGKAEVEIGDSQLPVDVTVELRAPEAGPAAK